MKSKLVNFVIACTLYSCYLQSGAVKQPLIDINPWDTKDLVQGTSMIYVKHVYLISNAYYQELVTNIKWSNFHQKIIGKYSYNTKALLSIFLMGLQMSTLNEKETSLSSLIIFTHINH